MKFCKNCIHNQGGQCYRFPPQLAVHRPDQGGHEKAYWYRPDVSGSSACGEHKKAPSKIAQRLKKLLP